MHRYEKETVINFDEETDTATIYTYNGGLKRKLANYAAVCPECCKCVRTDETGAVVYEVDKRRMFISFRRPLSEEEREKARANAKNLIH